MNIHPIRTDDDLRVAYERLELIFLAEPGTPEFDELETLSALIEAYENKDDAFDSARNQARNGSKT